MKITCEKCGHIMAVNNLGRPRGKYPIQNVLKAYGLKKNYKAVAEELGLSSGTVWRIVKNARNAETKQKAHS